MYSRSVLLLSFALSATAACTAAPQQIGDDTSEAATTKKSKTTASKGTFAVDAGTATTASTQNTDDCAEAAAFVYVVSSTADLYKFEPSKALFTKIGHLACPSDQLPNSMAVDRSGTAWINYKDGHIYKVNTTNAQCDATNFVPNQLPSPTFGMAFATSGDSTTETLYVGARGDADLKLGGGLAKIDLTTMALTRVGDFGGGLTGMGAELTGTGDGKLFGFFTTDPATLATVSPTTGIGTAPRSLIGVDTGTAYAFSFWGGDFWLYTALDNGNSSVTQFRSSDGQLVPVKADVGFTIVGSGVSTCAPLEAPK